METYLPIPYTIQKYNIHKQDSIKHFAELQKSKIKPKKIKAMKDLTPVGQLKNEKIYRFNIILDKKIFNVFYAKNENAWLLEYPHPVYLLNSLIVQDFVLLHNSSIFYRYRII